MIIISGKVYVDEDKRDEYLAQFSDLMARARKHPGCLDVVVADAPNLPFDKKRSDVQKHQVSESGPPFE